MIQVSVNSAVQGKSSAIVGKKEAPLVPLCAEADRVFGKDEPQLAISQTNPATCTTTMPVM